MASPITSYLMSVFDETPSPKKSSPSKKTSTRKSVSSKKSSPLKFPSPPSYDVKVTNLIKKLLSPTLNVPTHTPKLTNTHKNKNKNKNDKEILENYFAITKKKGIEPQIAKDYLEREMKTHGEENFSHVVKLARNRLFKDIVNKTGKKPGNSTRKKGGKKGGKKDGTRKK